MKMLVKAITPNWSRAEGTGAIDRGQDAYVSLRAERGRIVHLECGHEFRIPIDAPYPSHFDCTYCSRVPTIEEAEQYLKDRHTHQSESERNLR